LGGIEGLTGNTGLTGNESGALAGLEGVANRGNPFLGGIRDYANLALSGGPDRSGMINDAYKRYQDQLGSTANGDYMDPNKNPWFSQVTQSIGNDVQNRLSGLYAGSGRDPAGAGNFGYNLGKGVGEATAPIFSDAYNRERQNQLNAQGSLYGAGNTTGGLLSGLDTQRLANMQAGVGAAGSAMNAETAPFNQMLAAEAQRRGIPVSMLQQLAGIAGPIAQLGGTSKGTSTGTSTASGAQQFAQIGQGLGGFSKFLWG
jgi:hypothetical protein